MKFFNVFLKKTLIVLGFGLYISSSNLIAQCPDFNDCFSLLSNDGCTYTFIINVDGDNVFSDDSNPLEAHLVNWTFQVFGDAEIVSSGFVEPSGFLATSTSISIANTASMVAVSHIDLTNPIETHQLVGGHFFFTVDATAESCFTVQRTGTNGIWNFGGIGVCDVTGNCDPQEYCTDGQEISGNVTAPGNIYDCPDTENHGIEGVEVSITSPNGNTCNTVTENDGTYSCVFCDEGPFEICIDSNCEEPCGLTDFDLVLLFDYILSLKDWSIALQIIGDVNQDGNVSALDLITLQKVLLDIDTGIDINWCNFVPVEDYENAPILDDFSDDDNGFFEELDNCVEITDSSVSTDFLRFMIGDLDGSCSDCIHGDENGDIPIVVEEDEHRSIFRSSRNDRLLALTLHIEIPSGIEVIDINSPLPNFEYSISGNELHFIWIDLSEDFKGYSTLENDELLEIMTNENSNLTITGDQNFWYNKDFGIHNINDNAEVRNSSNHEDRQSIILNGSSTFQINQLDENENISFYNTSGQIVESLRMDHNTKEVNVNLPTGIYLIQVGERSVQPIKVFIK